MGVRLPGRVAAPAGRRAARSGAVAVNGMRLHYERHAAGEPLVLLHGFTGAGSDWAPFVDQLSSEHELIVPDLRGHGRSTNPSGEYTHRQSARDIFALLDRLGIANCQGIGVSGGAEALLDMATPPPSPVAALGPVRAPSYHAGRARGAGRAF